MNEEDMHDVAEFSRIVALMCVRNTPLEKSTPRETSVIQTGDYSLGRRNDPRR